MKMIIDHCTTSMSVHINNELINISFLINTIELMLYFIVNTIKNLKK